MPAEVGDGVAAGGGGGGGGGEKTTGAGGGWGTSVGATVGAETGAVVAKHLSQVVWQYPSGASAVGMVMKAAWQLPAILCSAGISLCE